MKLRLNSNSTFLLLIILVVIWTTPIHPENQNSQIQPNQKKGQLEPAKKALSQDNNSRPKDDDAKRQPDKEDDGTGLGLKPDNVPKLPDSDSISFVKSLMALCFVLGLIFLTAYLFKRFTGIKSTGIRGNRVPISMVGNFPLGEKRYLAVMEIQDKHYFIGITQNSINLLSELDLELEEPINEPPKDFENIFQKAKLILGKK